MHTALNLAVLALCTGVVSGCLDGSGPNAPESRPQVTSALGLAASRSERCVAVSALPWTDTADLHAVANGPAGLFYAAGEDGLLLRWRAGSPAARIPTGTKSTLLGMELTRAVSPAHGAGESGAGGAEVRLVIVGLDGSWVSGRPGSLRSEAFPEAGTLRAVRSLDSGAILAVGSRGAFLRKGDSPPIREEGAPDRLFALDVADDGTAVAAGDVGRIAFRAPGGGWSVARHDSLWNFRGVRIFAGAGRSGAGPNGVAVVGDEGGLLLLGDGPDGTASDPNSWRVLDSSTDELLTAISGTAPGDLFVTTGSGRLLHSDGGVFVKESLGAPVWLDAVAARLPGAQVAVGPKGVRVTRRDGRWWPEQPWAYLARDGVALPDGSVVLVGAAGQVARLGPGDKLVSMPAPTEHTLEAVVALGGDLLVAGGRGSAYLWESGGWKTEDTSTAEDLHGMAALPGGAAIAVGGHGAAVIREAGGRWRQVQLPTDRTIEAVAVGPAGTVWAVGGGGIVARRDQNGSWSILPGPDESDLFGVAVSAGGQILIAGTSGGPFAWTGSGWTPLPGRVATTIRWLRATPFGVMAAGEQGFAARIEGGRMIRLQIDPLLPSTILRILLPNACDSLLATTASGDLMRLGPCTEVNP